MRGAGRHVAALAVVAILAASALWPYVAESHGGVTEFRKERAGPYEVAFGTSPRSPSPGPVHVSLRVVDLAGGEPVPDAAVTLSGRVDGGQGSEPDSFKEVAAELYESDPVFWDADILIEQVGDWVFRVDVEGEVGSGAADFEVKVRSSSPVTGIITIIALVAFLTVVALAMRTYLSARRSGDT